jgi:GNAT superfamily N-acetyltransferase
VHGASPGQQELKAGNRVDANGLQRHLPHRVGVPRDDKRGVPRVSTRSGRYSTQQQFLFAEVDGETAGFCFGFPDWTPLFRSFNGKLGPLQIVRLLLRAKRYDRAGLLSIGVRDAYRGRHIGQTLAATLYRRYEELGLRGALYYPVNDHNIASRRLAESFGATGRIVYTAYDKPLV